MKYISSKILIFIIVASLISSCARSSKPMDVTPIDSGQIYILVTATPDYQAASPTFTVTPTTTLTPTIAPTPTPAIDCEQSDVDELLKELDDSIGRFKDIKSVAEQTPKISLSPIIVQLQDIRRQTNAIDSPDCGNFMRGFIGIAMSYDIKSFMDFMSNKTEEELTNSVHRANTVWNFALEKLDEFKKEPVESYKDFTKNMPEFSNYAASDSMETSAWKSYQMDGCNASFKYPSNIYEIDPMTNYFECGVMFWNIIKNGEGIIKVIKEDKYNFSQLTSDTIRMQSLILGKLAFYSEDSRLNILSTHKEKLGTVTAYYYILMEDSDPMNPFYSFDGVFITSNNEVFSFFSDGEQRSIEKLYLGVAREILQKFQEW